MIRDLLLAHGADPVVATLRAYQRQALDDIAACGTVASGMHWEACDQCGDRRMRPNTCGNRSCPHCQGRVRLAWVEARTQELLPCGYFHVVLTLPPELRAAAQGFQAVVLGALMRAATDAIDCLARDQRFLGAEVGQLAVLHTWTRDLRWHPHVHVIVTAGGLTADQRWKPAKTYGDRNRPFLVPVDVLKKAYAKRLQSLLLAAARAGAFAGHDGAPDGGGLAELASPDALARHLAIAMQREWVVRIEPPFGGPQVLLRYLGAYVSRTAVGPKRVAFDREAGSATLTFTPNATPGQAQTVTMPADEFIQRFAQHILPPRFQRIRFRGLWSTAHRATKLAVARAALASSPPPPAESTPGALATPPPGDCCTACKLGHYQRLPGRCPRPQRHARRTMLARIRAGDLHPTTPEATTPA